MKNQIFMILMVKEKFQTDQVLELLVIKSRDFLQWWSYEIYQD